MNGDGQALLEMRASRPRSRLLPRSSAVLESAGWERGRLARISSALPKQTDPPRPRWPSVSICGDPHDVRHALAALLGTVQRTIREHAMLAPGDRVLVAVSGGRIRLGLLLALAQLRRKLGVELVAAHVNHRLRGADADADEAAAAAAAERLGVPFVRCELGGRSACRGANLEARARATALRGAAARWRRRTDARGSPPATRSTTRPRPC